MKYIGIDPSYNGFAIIVLDENGELEHQSVHSTKAADRIEVRLAELEAIYTKLIESYDIDVAIAIEEPAYASKGKFILQMGALHYQLRRYLFTKGNRFVVVPPTTLKKFVTGKGNCKKDLMLLKVYKKWGVEFDNDNLADGYGLAQYAMANDSEIKV